MVNHVHTNGIDGNYNTINGNVYFNNGKLYMIIGKLKNNNGSSCTHEWYQYY